MKNQTNNWMLLLVIVISFVACNTPTALYRKGEYDASVERAIEKLRGRKPKDKDLLALEAAFNSINMKDKARLEFLLKDPSDEKWDDVHVVSQRIAYRQRLVKPYLPVYIKSEHREVALKMFDVDDLVVQSKEKAAEALYQVALTAMESARKGDKTAARKAYDRLAEIKRYYSNYKNRDQLMQEAHALGISRVLVKFSNRSASMLPFAFEREMQSAFSGDTGNDWLEYHTTARPDVSYDYTFTTTLEFINVSPESVNNRQFTEEKEIQDGWIYVLDGKGNVMKDSLGNDIKNPKYVRVSAAVNELWQHKEAKVSGRIECIDNSTGRIAFSNPISAGNVFDNYAVTFAGDKRALSNETRNRLGNSFMPFPTDEEMVMRAAGDLKAAARNAAWQHNNVLVMR